MKTKLVFAAIVAAFTMVSCGGGGNGKKSDKKDITEKNIKTSQVKFDSADQLSEYIEIVDTEHLLKYDGENEYGSETLSLTMKIRLAKENPEFQEAGADKIIFEDSFGVTLAVFIEDSNNESLEGFYIYKSDPQTEAIKKLLTGKVGDELELKLVLDGVYQAKEVLADTDHITPYCVSETISLDTPAGRAAKQKAMAARYPSVLQPENVILPSSLKGSVEVINGVDGFIPVFVGEYGYAEVHITFKLLKTVNTSPLCTPYGQMWLAGVPQDSAGRNISDLIPSYDEWRSQDSDGSEFKAFLESEPGETITMEFTGTEATFNECKGIGRFKLFTTK